MTFNSEDMRTEADAQAPAITASARDSAWLEERLKRGKRECFSEIVTVTPGMAAAFMEHNEHNRGLAKRRAEKYATIIREGRWKVTHQGIAFDKAGNMLDGQHRSAGIILANLPVKVMVSFGWDAENFSLIDTGANRSGGDLAKIDGMTYSHTRPGVAAHWFAATEGLDGGARPDRQKIHMLVRELDDADMEKACCFGQALAAARISGSSGSAFGIYWIMRHTQKPMSKIATFMDGVLHGAELPVNSPILRFRENAKAMPTQDRRGFKQAAAMVLAWNAWVSGKRLGSMAWKHVSKMPEVV